MLADLIAHDIAVRLVAVIADLSPLSGSGLTLRFRYERVFQWRIDQAEVANSPRGLLHRAGTQHRAEQDQRGSAPQHPWQL